MTASPTYEDETAPVNERTADLLGRLTLREKAGQLSGLFASEVQADPYESYTLDDVEHAVREHAIGSVTPFATGFSSHNSPAVVPRIANRLQRIAREETRLGIPLLVPVDAVHGHANVKGATVFPHNLGMAATWNPALIRRAARATAAEMRATGATMNYSPNADVAREPRWGRTYETYGESPHLVGELAAAEVAGLQNADSNADDTGGDPSSRDPLETTAVAATVKHFPAYSAPARGEDAAPVDISPSTLHRVFVPPFDRAIDAGVAAVMPTYSAVDGEPAHGSRRYLTSLLRDDLGFDGLVQSDWHGVAFLYDRHRTASSPKEAAAQAVGAGLDVASIGGPEYAKHLCELVESGRLSEERLDESVRRVLELKFRLGLFDDPYVDPRRSREVVGRSAHRELSLECARESVVLLDNDDALPFNDPDEVLVTGPNADSLDALCGGWTVADLAADHGTTILEGLSNATDDDTTVAYEPGATVREEINIEAAADAAVGADAAVVVCGENWYVHEFGPKSMTGPNDAFPNRTQLRLPDAQRRLLERVADTGTPTVLVVATGRPLAIPDEVQVADATLAAFYPGYEAGQAIGEILIGATNPSGRLPISMPRSISQLPLVHDHRPHPQPLGGDEHPDAYDPLFAFGHGLSYAEFEYESIDCTADQIEVGNSLDVTVTVANRGDRAGTEVVQLYVRDIVSSRVTPVRELAGFDRVSIPSGEKQKATMTLKPSDLAVIYSDGSRVVEPGRFEVSSGGLSMSFTVVE
ncbi:glycoside hydrolase family 3 N-terminal domain-containing protein [Halopiger xanaduensis]|uniref:beta-glucosidase n=1 Tax=Halopiger xanaduensis (strain DSM 18323 / JCM 14033 / SH-6) TaxID=797210 RepID=F8DDY5_HALXS|nr:glycoside hydrolase family 3 N-terminal domain-containing protein [Halopiger xanaduensis]AEH39240.1 Beta-glucosidase [Halopiger xanaduensis SH-6]